MVKSTRSFKRGIFTLCKNYTTFLKITLNIFKKKKKKKNVHNKQYTNIIKKIDKQSIHNDIYKHLQ